MNDKLQVFSNTEFGELAIIKIEDKPYFPATQCAKILGYSNANDAVIRHCRRVMKCKVPYLQSPNKTIEKNFIPEGDLYRLIVRSKLLLAERFERWIFDEVLPSIRKHGVYMTPDKIEEIISNPDIIIKLATTLKEEKNKRVLAEQQTKELLTQLDKSKRWYTIKYVAQLNRINSKTLDWKKLKEQSEKMNLKVDKIFNANFGTVNCYHEDVWKTVYPKLVY